MKQVFISGLIFISQIGLLHGQDLPILKPEIDFELDFSPESIAKFQSDEAFQACRRLYQKRKNEGRISDKYNNEEKKALFYCDETRETIWDIIGGACSWYCGEGPKRVTASSYLSSKGSENYKSRNAHDLNYKNAWVEGATGYGTGEYLLYTFNGTSPRINEIIVVNGYVKNKAAWQDYSRAKELKMYLNDKPHTILELKDSRGEQRFKIDPIGNSNRNWETLKTKPDWTLKFEILDVYKGLKYDDVAISEIYFDGLDVH